MILPAVYHLHSSLQHLYQRLDRGESCTHQNPAIEILVAFSLLLVTSTCTYVPTREVWINFVTLHLDSGSQLSNQLMELKGPHLEEFFFFFVLNDAPLYIYFCHDLKFSWATIIERSFRELHCCNLLFFRLIDSWGLIYSMNVYSRASHWL